MIARILVARDNLSMNRQVFFINRGGWDHHNELLIPQSALLSEVDEAMEAFWTELGLHGLQEDVVLFSASDFGRTLTSNGLGTDHAWAGNHFVLGGQVNGGRIYGSYPELASGSALDIGRGAHPSNHIRGRVFFGDCLLVWGACIGAVHCISQFWELFRSFDESVPAWFPAALKLEVS
jgi:uncharacterized protein (DUF1501 family)